MNKIIWVIIFAVSFTLLFSMIANRFINEYKYIEIDEYSMDEKMTAVEDKVESSSESFNTFSTILKYIKEILTILSMTVSILMFIKKE